MNHDQSVVGGSFPAFPVVQLLLHLLLASPSMFVCLFVCVCCFTQSLEADPVLDELEGTQKAVQQAYSICQKGSVSHTDLQTSIRDLYDALQ